MIRILLPVLLLAAAVAVAQEDGVSSCIACHGDPEIFDEEDRAPVLELAGDVHGEVGLSCHDCHGGNPEAGPDDMDAAMDPHFEANSYLGVPERAAIPRFCSRCHSDPTFMRRFRPDLRVDQEEEYWTSQHGRALRAGDERVATCVDCHGVHGILRASDPRSPVYPTRVAETCRRCHEDGDRMAGSTSARGEPLAVDQYVRWRRSVHAAALIEGRDLSAPTCNDCHGNHGAAPPGLDSIAFVCGQCHGREAELFRASEKRDLYSDHNDYLEEVEGEGCVACHEEPEPQVELAGVHALSECDSCHGHHAVLRPTVALLSPLPPTPCAFCHEGIGPLGEAFPEPLAPSRNYESTREMLLAEAPRLEAEALFDALVDRALSLPFHAEAGPEGERRLRPEFERLFTKFRIGKTRYSYEDPAAEAALTAEIRRCGHCHGAEPVLGDPVGHETARAFLEGMWELTAMTARAERILLRARRGGVETRHVQAEIDQAIDAQIELEVLVHSFAADEESAFGEKRRQGLEHARAALEAGQEAVAELGSRRLGLAVSLVFILLVLITLGLKIRQLPTDEEASES